MRAALLILVLLAVPVGAQGFIHIGAQGGRLSSVTLYDDAGFEELTCFYASATATYASGPDGGYDLVIRYAGSVPFRADLCPAVLTHEVSSTEDVWQTGVTHFGTCDRLGMFFRPGPAPAPAAGTPGSAFHVVHTHGGCESQAGSWSAELTLVQ